MLQRSLLLSSALGGTARALVIRQDGCSFRLSAEGTISAPVSQYGSGQARAGANETATSFNLNGDTTLTDSQGRGCWWTPPATVLQCDVGQTPGPGFTVGCDGTLSYNGQTTFYTCDTGADGLWMIYLTPSGSQCGEITLHADGCSPSSCGTSSSSAAPGSSGTGGSSCPGELGDTYQYPHLIIPVDSSSPSSAPGTSYYGQVTDTLSSVFNFDIPQSYAGKTCTAVFYLPSQSQLETSSVSLSGSGSVEFSRLSSSVSAGTSYANLAGTAQSYGQQTLALGKAYTLSSFACPAGQSIAFKISAAQGDSSTNLRYFQDYNPCPIGLYITAS
ncbi:ubiquitin 3 binding protein But2 C-terminal domain-containing protein [Xylaria arbuscula]|nr:ubiquitin 3 binding protein But2 C-terminal domain-containing protein [Xylaria arbuscula]